MGDERALTRLVAALREEQRRRWQQGDHVLAEVYLRQYPELQVDAACALELVYQEVLLRQELGESPLLDEYLRRFPQWADQLKPLFEVHRALESGELFATCEAGPGASGAAPAAETVADLPSIPGFEVLRELGRGGMGVVYWAWQSRLSRTVALKMILAGDHASPRQRARFRIEAEAIGRLQHPNIVPIYELGEHAGRPYLAMEYVDGGSLAQKLTGTPLPTQPAARLAETLARAVHYAHQRGIVHRDLTPANVLLTTEDVPKITDFGLAKIVVGGGEAQTQTGMIAGTPSYMAPEQAAGQTRDVGPAADVYALGAILYELLTGRPPFRAESALETLLQVQQEEPVPPSRLQPRVGRDLETVCLKCLQKDASKRYASADALAEDLQRYLRGEPIQARRTSAPERAWRWCRRNPLVSSLTAAVAMLLLVMTIGAALAAWQQHGLAEAAVAAKNAEQAQRQRAEELLERQYVGRVTQLTGEGDFYGALPWIVECLRLAKGDPAREEMHRYRLAAVLHGGPKCVQVWFHEGPVNCAEFSPDGRSVVTASRDHSARVWDVTTGKSVTVLRGHSDAVALASFRSDGRRVLTVSEDTTARVWDPATGQQITAFRKHTAGLAYATFSPDGRSVVTAGKDGMARLWDADTGRELIPPLRHDGAMVRYATFSLDGRYVLTVSTDGKVRVWETATGKLIGWPLAHAKEVLHASFSPAASRVVTACKDAKAHVWEVATSKPVWWLAQKALPAFGASIVGLQGSPSGQGSFLAACALIPGKEGLDHVNVVTWATFSPTGRQVLTASLDSTARVRDVASGEEVATLEHSGPVLQASFSHDGQRVVTASMDRTAGIWNVAKGTLVTPLLQHNGSVNRASFSPDGRYVVTASADGTARLWDVGGYEPRMLPPKHRALVRWASFSPDGQYVVTASFDRSARVWDLATDKVVNLTHNRAVQYAAFSPDSRRVVTVSFDGNACVWKVETGEPVTEPLEHPAFVECAAFSPDGRYVVTACDDGKARVWNAATGKLERFLKCTGKISYAAFSPDGRYIATVGVYDNTGYVWNAATGEPVASLPPAEHLAFSPDSCYVVTAGAEGRVYKTATGEPVGAPLRHNSSLNYVAFSPDGRYVATASLDQTARIWEAATGEPVGVPLRHTGRVVHLSFSPDGRRLVTASYTDARVRVWEVATGEPVTPVFQHPDSVWHASFSPDGRHVLTACGDGSARLWDTPFEDRPLDDLVLLAQVLAGVQMRAPGTFLPLEPAQFNRDWATLWSKYPGEFLASPSENALQRK